MDIQFPVGVYRLGHSDLLCDCKHVTHIQITPVVQNQPKHLVSCVELWMWHQHVYYATPQQKEDINLKLRQVVGNMHLLQEY